MQFWDLSSDSSFHAQIRQFWKLTDISKTAVHRAKISLISTPGVERSTYATLGPVFKFQILCPNMEFWKLACISKTAACGANISSISSPWGRKRVHAKSGTFFQILYFMPEYSNFDNHAVFWKLPQTLASVVLQPFLHSFIPKTGMQILNLPAKFCFLDLFIY